jgi:membrane protein implicated in regulation of membrane protease activity
MNTETITWIWLIAGIVLMLSEFLIPGLVVVFLGLAAVLIAIGRWTGLIDNLLDSFTYWFVLTVAIILVLRGLVARFFSGDVSITRSSDDEEALGRVVKVTEEVGSDHDLGRIHFRGTTWKAKSEYGRAFPGQQVKIVGRDNLVWIVDPVDSNEEYHVPIDSLAKKSPKKFLIGAKKSKGFLKKN